MHPDGPTVSVLACMRLVSSLHLVLIMWALLSEAMHCECMQAKHYMYPWLLVMLAESWHVLLKTLV